MFHPAAIVPQVLSNFLEEHINISYSSETLLDGGSLASHSSHHVARHYSSIPCCKISNHGCFGKLGVEGSAIAAFNALDSQRCALCRQGFSSLVCQAVVGATEASTKKFTTGMNGSVDVLERVCQTMSFLPLN